MVSEHGSPLGLDGWCVGHAFMSVAYMCSLCLWFMCLLCMHGGGRCCSCVATWKLIVIVVGCGRHKRMLVMCLLCMSFSICRYACIVMVMA